MTKGVIGNGVNVAEKGCTRVWLLASSPEGIGFALTHYYYLINQITHPYTDHCNKVGNVLNFSLKILGHLSLKIWPKPWQNSNWWRNLPQSKKDGTNLKQANASCSDNNTCICIISVPLKNQWVFKNLYRYRIQLVFLLCCIVCGRMPSVARRLWCSLKLKNLCNLSPSAVSVSACWTSLEKLLSFNKVYMLHVLKKEKLLGNPISCNICKLICFLRARMICNSQQS